MSKFQIVWHLFYYYYFKCLPIELLMKNKSKSEYDLESVLQLVEEYFKYQNIKNIQHPTIVVNSTNKKSKKI